MAGAQSESGVIADVRITLDSGDRFYLAPTEESRPGEQYPELGISFEIVQSFPVLRRWPNGPTVESSELESAAACLGKRIRSAKLSGLFSGTVEDSLLLVFEDSFFLRISHSHSLPLSLQMEMAKLDQ